MGEVETKIISQRQKARATDHRFGLARTERDCIAIEGDAAHDIARAGIPWVVLPKREPSARTKRFIDVAHRRGPVVRRDVMEDAIAEDQIDQPRWTVMIHVEERRADTAVLSLRN